MGLPKAIKNWSLRSVKVKLFKIGAPLVRHARRLVFQFAEVASRERRSVECWTASMESGSGCRMRSRKC